MKPEEVKQMFGRVESMYRIFGAYWTDSIAIGWADALKGITYDEFQAAYTQLIRTGERLPRPADFWVLINQGRAKRMAEREEREYQASRGELIPMPDHIKQQIERAISKMTSESDDDN